VLAVPSILFLLYLVVDGVYWSWQVSVGIKRPDDNDTLPAWIIFLALILALVGADIYADARQRTIFWK
jgi:hypothetical protein